MASSVPTSSSLLLKWRGSNLGRRNKIKSRVDNDNTGKMQRDWDHVYNGIEEPQTEEEEDTE